MPTAPMSASLRVVGRRTGRSAQKQRRDAIAQWRYEQIEEALPALLTRAGRAEVIREIGLLPVVWPSGEVAPVPRATAYRWIALYRSGGLPGLCPKPRKDRGQKKARLPDDVVKRATELWTSDPEMGLPFLIELLMAERGIRIARSTLSRRLAEHEPYVQLSSVLKRERRRRRYVARAPHDIWHLDAKGWFLVRLTSGAPIKVHVLTVLDDATRDALAWLVVLHPDLRAAVRVFRMAAKRWGIPKLQYVDRASIFDSHAFRRGLADLGTHRIRTRARNPEAHGKIEAYHRSLSRWFCKRLPRQRVIDLVHLQQLLDAVIERVYRDHRHRDLQTSPRAALGDRVSSRFLSAQRLDDAFRQKLRKKAHRKTGEVDLPGGKYIVPEELGGQHLVFLIDPEGVAAPLVVHPKTERRLALVRAAVRSEDARVAEPEPVERWADGPLQTLYDAWQGKRRPNAEPGFGLPEIFALLTSVAGRHVPKSDAEAARVHRAWQTFGPLAKKPTDRALADIARELGPGRPLETYLDALERRVTRVETTKKRNRE